MQLSSSLRKSFDRLRMVSKVELQGSSILKTWIPAFAGMTIILKAQNALACSACFFGDPSDKMNQGLRGGIFFLLFVLLGILFLFAKFFIGIARRSKS